MKERSTGSVAARLAFVARAFFAASAAMAIVACASVPAKAKGGSDAGRSTADAGPGSKGDSAAAAGSNPVALPAPSAIVADGGSSASPDDRDSYALKTTAEKKEATKDKKAADDEHAASGGAKAAASGSAPRDGLAAAESVSSTGATTGAAKPGKSPTASTRASDAAGDLDWDRAEPAREVPSESGLKAGFSDDNAQFNYFLRFLEQYGKEVEYYPLKIQDRIVLNVGDSAGKPVADADIVFTAGGKKAGIGRTLADGSYTFYPLEFGGAMDYRATVTYGTQKKEIQVARDGARSLNVVLDVPRAAPRPLPLDLLFVLDTTGSMGEEIERLRSTIEIINANLLTVNPKPKIRFGMVLYRDKEDYYVTKVVPFTEDLAAFQAELDKIDADGGGDGPEDLQSALKDSIQSMKWNADGLRLAFVVTDAPAHLDYGQSYSYASAARDARAKAIKFFTVGTGGLPLDGEILLRQLAQFTGGKYIFLTYGEKGESAGGAEASVSHHTGTNFQTDKLEAIIMRFAKEELAWQSDAPLTSDDPWFDAKKISAEQREETLSKLFTQSLANLSDYSTLKVGPETKALLLPVQLGEGQDESLRKQAEYFAENILLASAKAKTFTMVDRSNLQKILEEQEFQQSGLVDEKRAVKVGNIMGAEVLVLPKIFEKGGKYELYFKLLRVETGEVLSVSKAKLEKDLGL